LLVYTQNLSPRVDYIFSTLLHALGVSNYNLTDDKTFFIKFEQEKFNYSLQRITQDEFWIQPVALLFEKEIKEQTIDFFEWNKTKAFFRIFESDFPFDIFAASFYLITRYEEYLPHQLDFYGRYAHENSIAFKENFLKLPLVNIWLQHFATEIIKKFPSLHLMPPAFRFLPTYDIDIAWSYLHKGWLRNVGGLMRSMMEGEWAAASERINVLFGNQEDPFDSYLYLDELHEGHKLNAIYFFLAASKNKDYDKNILPRKKALQKLIRQTASKYRVGIHPSWQSGDNPELLKPEIEILEKIIGSKVTQSRQHYVRMTLPHTYRQLIAAGITEDYSMGYGSINGFRASYCLPYKWYDLQKEEITNLTIFPFCYMDANSFFEQHYASEEALAEMKHYYTTVKEVNGLLITIWHNNFLGTDRMFKGWRDIYRTMIKTIYQE
jgi:hypothetical protein